MTTRLNFAAQCPDCGFSSRDVYLLNGHSCDVQLQGGQCEDYPCCGHERGDCNGLLYGSDESIQAEVYAQIREEDGWYPDEWDDEYH